MWRIGLICLICAGVAGCSSVNSFLAAKVADTIPEWAGGLPPDAPPRPGDPRYPQYEQELKKDLAAPKGKDVKAANPAKNAAPDQQ